jgi:pyrroline-5-carboxylate reductase
VSDPTIAFIGAGNMASAIIGGLVAKGYASKKIHAADPVQANLQRLQDNFAIQVFDDNLAAIEKADVLILAVKPQSMAALAQQIKPGLEKQPALVISIAAGITLGSLQGWLGAQLPIVRCMPNTPALVQSAATALFANQHVSEQQHSWANQLLSSIGLALWVEQEAQLDAVTAVSGSGPAYFFLVMEAMIEAGKTLGLSHDQAERLTLQTALGAAKMAADSDVDVAELRRRVSSPGGTTLAALQVLEEGKLRELFISALSAAQERSSQLAKELGS